MAGLIIALDCEFERARQVVEATRHLDCGYKLGMRSILDYRYALMPYIRGRRLMLDLKLYDTPDTVQAVIKIAREQYQPRLLTVHPTAAKAAYSVAGGDASPSPLIISVPILTSQEAQGDTSLYHYFHHHAGRHDCNGFVCAAPDLPAARKACTAAGRPDMILVCPGIRLAGEDHHNHRRFGTPEAAYAAGADYLVVGRSITEAADHAAAAQKFMPG